MQMTLVQCRGQGEGAGQGKPGMAVGGRLPRLAAALHGAVLGPCTLPAALPITSYGRPSVASIQYMHIRHHWEHQCMQRQIKVHLLSKFERALTHAACISLAGIRQQQMAPTPVVARVHQLTLRLFTHQTRCCKSICVPRHVRPVHVDQSWSLQLHMLCEGPCWLHRRSAICH